VKGRRYNAGTRGEEGCIYAAGQKVTRRAGPMSTATSRRAQGLGLNETAAKPAGCSTASAFTLLARLYYLKLSLIAFTI